MASNGDQGESLRELIARLIESGQAYVRAEVALVQKTIAVRLEQAKPAAAFAIGALLLALAGLIVLLAALGLAIGAWIGAAGGLAVAGLLALLAAGLLVWLAIGRFTDITE